MLTPRSDIGSQFMGKIRKKKSIFGDLMEESEVEEGREPSFFVSKSCQVFSFVFVFLSNHLAADK